MEKKVTIYASEQEIVELIQKFITPKFDSIVAAEEIGNQDWTATVELPGKYELEDVQEVLDGDDDGQWKTRALMCYLHKLGHLEAGEYVVDCTW